MTNSADFLIIGGGIAGVSAAAALAKHGKTIVLEAEDALAYHSSGRSATFYHFGIGNRTVRALTSFSRAFFEMPPDGFSDVPLCHPTPALFIANKDMLSDLRDLHAEMKLFTDTTSTVTGDEITRLCPVLKVGEDAIVEGVIDTGGRRLDANQLVQSYQRQVRAHGGEVHTSQRIDSLEFKKGRWRAGTLSGQTIEAPIVINAAGAWADHIARMGGLTTMGLSPKRRTIIVFEAPEGIETRNWPFVKTARDEFYMIPESGKLMASPVDEIESEPVDAAPEEYDIALAAWRVQEYTQMEVRRIGHKWAGLRTFSPDRTPVVGFASDGEGFFWLAGQGGYGLQTAPAMATIAESLIVEQPWPQELHTLGVTQDQLSPERFA